MIRPFSLVVSLALFGCSASKTLTASKSESAVSEREPEPVSDIPGTADPVVEPAPRVSLTLWCASASTEDGVFRGELVLPWPQMWSLDGSWQPRMEGGTDGSGSAHGWSGSSGLFFDTPVPEVLEAGQLHLVQHPTRAGWAASGAVQDGETLLPISCFQGQPVPVFRYEAGQCTDAKGIEGLNAWPIELVRELGQGECNDFNGVRLNEGRMDDTFLTNWNLRGARLDGARLDGARLEDADLEGAQLSEIRYGDAQITGTVDIHTRYPGENCTQEGDALTCSR